MHRKAVTPKLFRALHPFHMTSQIFVPTSHFGKFHSVDHFTKVKRPVAVPGMSSGVEKEKSQTKQNFDMSWSFLLLYVVSLSFLLFYVVIWNHNEHCVLCLQNMRQSGNNCGKLTSNHVHSFKRTHIFLQTLPNHIL